MAEITVIFKNNNKELKSTHKKEEYLTDIFENYAKQTNTNIKDIYFIHDKNILNSRLEQLSQQNNKEIEFEVNFYEKNIICIKNPIICPKCSECCIFQINDYKINLYDCLNNHKFSKISINEFLKSQNEINLNDSFLICKIHNNEKFTCYCDNCKKNLCKQCEETHEKEHKIIPLKNFENIISLKEKLQDFENELKELKQNIKLICDNFNIIINNFENIYKIYYDTINNYQTNQLNYQILKNLDINQNIIDDMKKINKNTDIKTQINYLMEIFDKMKEGNIININEDDKELSIDEQNNDDKISEKKKEITLKLTYLLNKPEKLKLVDEEFIKNINNDDVSLSYDDIDFSVTEYITNDIIFKDLAVSKKATKIEFKIKNAELLTDLSYMFYNCSSLYSVSGFNEFDINIIKNMNSMFYGCSNLVSLPDIGDLNVSNVTDMSCLFYGCKSLSNLIGIDKWDVSKVTNMSYFFSDCEKLEKISDISKWDISNLKNINFMFNGCKLLTSLPGVQMWDIKNIKRKEYMFDNCGSLKEIPVIF